VLPITGTDSCTTSRIFLFYSHNFHCQIVKSCGRTTRVLRRAALAGPERASDRAPRGGGWGYLASRVPFFSRTLSTNHCCCYVYCSYICSRAWCI
jgi:hypothetical protein